MTTPIPSVAPSGATDEGRALVATPANCPPSASEHGAPARRLGSVLRELFVRSPDSSKVAALDGARAIAVLMVVVHHAWLTRCGLFRHDCNPEVTGEPLSVFALGLFVGHGDLGVDIFFVLSGYLIFFVLYGWFERGDRSARSTIQRFLARRFLRIYPALAVMIPLNMWMFGWIPGKDAGAAEILAGCQQHWWSNYLLVNNIAPLGGTVFGLVGESLACAPWTWSIAIEWQFYLLSPFLVWYYARGQRRGSKNSSASRVPWWRGMELMLALGLLSLATRLAAVLAFELQAPGLADEQMNAYMGWLYTNPLTRCTPYLLGMMAAAYRRCADRRSSDEVPAAERGSRGDVVSVLQEPRPRFLRTSIAVILFFTLVGVLPFFPWPSFNLFLGTLGRTLFSAAVTGVLVAGSAPYLPRSRTLRMLRHRLWHPLAQASYSMYLWQFAAIELARWLFLRQGWVPYQSAGIWTLFALACIVLSFLIGALGYLAIERPFMRVRPSA